MIAFYVCETEYFIVFGANYFTERSRHKEEKVLIRGILKLQATGKFITLSCLTKCLTEIEDAI